MDLHLPSEMEPFRVKLLQTTQTFIRIHSGPPRRCMPWESKTGGIPYLPKNARLPADPDGKPLFFLAQLNFAEMPALKPYPEKGLLQFFINDDDLYGMDFDDGRNTDHFRVVYYPDVHTDPGKLQPGIEIPESFENLPHHPDECYPFSFTLEEEVVPMTDYRFYETFGAGFFRQFGEKEWQVSDAFGRAVRAHGHKTGGYAYFTQDDPRTPADPMLLLFQLDSDERMDLMWGDMGVGHFFIRENDLKSLDFSRVLYDWDCL